MVVELAGRPGLAGLDGQSLGPLLADPDGPGRGPACVVPPVSSRLQRAWSLRTETVRYTLWPDGSEVLSPDLRSKAAEAENVAARPERAAEKTRLRARSLQVLVAGSARSRGAVKTTHGPSPRPLRAPRPRESRVHRRLVERCAASTG